MRTLLLCSTVLALASEAAPDILPPGHKSVRHQLALEIGEGQAEAKFVAWPIAGLRGAGLIEPGQPFSFSTKYGTRIYRLDAGEAWPSQRAVGPDFLSSHPSGIPCREIASVPASNPLAAVVSTYRVTGVQHGALLFEAVGEQWLDANGNPVGPNDLWPWLLVIALTGAAGLVAIANKAARTTA